MKVLFVTCPRFGLDRGGLQIQTEKTAEELGRLGVEVVLYSPWKNQIENVDICHIFSSDGSMLPHMQKAAAKNKPVVISPILSCFQGPTWLTALKVKLSNFPGVFTDLVRAKSMFELSAKILVLNSDERDIFTRTFKMPHEKCLIVPNGIEKRFACGDPSLFKDKYGVSDFVLNVGAIDPNKNQLTLIKAVAGLPHKLVIVGQARTGQEDYVQKCRAWAGDNVIFTGQLSYEDPLLASAYAAAKLFVLPSYSEVMPLTLYEAASTGCKIIASRNFPLAQEIRQYIQTFDPDKPTELAALIEKQMNSDKDNKLKKIVSQMPSWADIVGQIKKIYEEVLLEKQGQADILRAHMK